MLEKKGGHGTISDWNGRGNTMLYLVTFTQQHGVYVPGWHDQIHFKKIILVVLWIIKESGTSLDKIRQTNRLLQCSKLSWYLELGRQDGEMRL